MNKENILKEIEKGTSIYDLPLRVTFYARVSTEKEVQINSLKNQIAFFKDKIAMFPQWTYIDGYIDEGKSGGKAEKRPEFMRMVRDAKDGKFDLILTKEISRFARNTVDSLTYSKELYKYGVGVKFENDGLTTFDKDGNLRLTIMSSLAEDELRKLSERIKFGHREAMKKGVVLGNNRIWGYRKNKGRLEIVEEEAEMVRLIFELYASGEYSFKKIERILYEKGYRNLKGKKICHSTLSNIIQNAKYKGFYVGGKSNSSDYLDKIQIPNPEEEWIVFKDETGDRVPAIVSEEIWEKANRIFEYRRNDVISRQNKTNHPNLLTGKMICTHCGLPYYRKDAATKTGGYHSIWRCSGKINNGKDSCPSFSIYEEEIKPVLLELFTDESVDVDAIVESYCNAYKTMMENSDYPRLLKVKKETLERLEQKKRTLLNFLLDGTLSKRDYQESNEYLSSEIEVLRVEIDEIESKIISDDALEELLGTLQKNLT